MEENYYDKAISFKALYQSLKISCRSVRWKDSVIRYEAYGLKNTWLLRQSLLNDTYQISPYQCFTIHEPKERIIYAPRLVDRQVQRSLCDNGLYEDITEHFIRDNTACQKGRGTDDALRRFKFLLQRYIKENNNSGWVLKCDIHHFFPSTKHEIVKKAARKYISDEKARDMVCKVIDSFNGDTGLGLGSQISQITELLVLNDLDHFIKERLHIKCYIRYMDDFILVHPSKEYLQFCLKEIKKYLNLLELNLNKKTEIQPLKHGIIFLKWKYIIDNNKIIMLMNSKKITKQKKRIKKLWAREKDNNVLENTTSTSLISFIANAKRGNTYRIQKVITEFYNNLTGRDLYDRKLQKEKTRRSTKCGNCFI